MDIFIYLIYCGLFLRLLIKGCFKYLKGLNRLVTQAGFFIAVAQISINSRTEMLVVTDKS